MQLPSQITGCRLTQLCDTQVYHLISHNHTEAVCMLHGVCSSQSVKEREQKYHVWLNKYAVLFKLLKILFDSPNMA